MKEIREISVHVEILFTKPEGKNRLENSDVDWGDNKMGRKTEYSWTKYRKIVFGEMGAVPWKA